MEKTEFEKKVDRFRDRLEMLLGRASGVLSLDPFLQEALEELSTSLEELQVAGEELRVQND